MQPGSRRQRPSCTPPEATCCSFLLDGTSMTWSLDSLNWWKQRKEALGRRAVDPPAPSPSVAPPTLLHRATQLGPALLHRAGHPPSPTALSLQCSRSSSRPPSPRPSTLQQMRSPRAPRRRPAIPPAHGIQGHAGGRRQGRTQRAPCREKARFPQLFFPSLSLQGDAWLEEGQLVLVCRLSASKVSFSGELLNSAVVTAPIVP
jgi:hypothetical protein